MKSGGWPFAFRLSPFAFLWRLRSTTQAQPAHFPNRCRVSVLAVDITDRFIAPIVNGQLRDVAETIDQNTPGLTNMQPIARDIWRSLQEPAEVAPRTYFVFEPLTAALGPVSGEGLQVKHSIAAPAARRSDQRLSRAVRCRAAL